MDPFWVARPVILRHVLTAQLAEGQANGTNDRLCLFDSAEAACVPKPASPQVIFESDARAPAAASVCLPRSPTECVAGHDVR